MAVLVPEFQIERHLELDLAMVSQGPSSLMNGIVPAAGMFWATALHLP
jgi:hypothetical protein